MSIRNHDLHLNSMSLYKMLDNGTTPYCVPSYQRGYEWTKDSWMGIWREFVRFVEMRSDEDDGYPSYLGQVVVRRGNASCEVIDGQQRLTTTVVFYAALAYVLRARLVGLRASQAPEYLIKHTEECLSRVRALVYTIRRENGKRVHKARVELQPGDHAVLQALIELIALDQAPPPGQDLIAWARSKRYGGANRETLNAFDVGHGVKIYKNKTTHPLLDACAFFVRRLTMDKISSSGKTALDHYFDSIEEDFMVDDSLDKFADIMKVAELVLSDQDNSLSVFANINQYGEPLKPHTLVNAVFLSLAPPMDERSAHSEFTAFYDGVWRAELYGDPFWSENNYRSLEAFLFSWIVFKKHSWTAIKSMVNAYRDTYERLDSQELLSEMKRIISAAKKFKERSLKAQSIKSSPQYRRTTQSHGFLERFFYLCVRTIDVNYYALLLWVDEALAKNQITTEEAERGLRIVESYIIRRNLTRTRNNKAIPQLLQQLKDVQQGDFYARVYEHFCSPSTAKDMIIPDDDTVRGVLETADFYKQFGKSGISKDFGITFLGALEDYLLIQSANNRGVHGSKVDVELTAYCDFQIEHLFPQNPSEAEWGADAITLAETHSGRIGNLFRIHQDDNLRASCKSVDKKLYVLHDQIQGSRYPLLHRALGNMDDYKQGIRELRWGKAEIEHNTQQVIDLINEVWKARPEKP